MSDEYFDVFLEGANIEPIYLGLFGGGNGRIESMDEEGFTLAWPENEESE